MIAGPHGLLGEPARYFPPTMSALKAFALQVLHTLEVNEEWSSETLDEIAADAIDRGLAFTEPEEDCFRALLRCIRPHLRHQGWPVTETPGRSIHSSMPSACSWACGR